MADRKYLVYQVTNRFDNKIYVGVHSTLNKDDRYMGSGVEIKEALKKYGRKSFVKEILFEYDTKEEMLAKEKEIVTKEFCMREDTYNRIEGGGTYLTENMVTVINPDGGFMNVYRDDLRWLSGELKGSTTGSTILRNKLSIDPVLAEEFKQRGIRAIKIAYARGLVNPNTFIGKQHRQESKDAIGRANSVKQQGSGNSQFGTMWVTRENKNKKIKKSDLEIYLIEGWVKGRK